MQFNLSFLTVAFLATLSVGVNALPSGAQDLTARECIPSMFNPID